MREGLEALAHGLDIPAFTKPFMENADVVMDELLKLYADESGGQADWFSWPISLDSYDAFNRGMRVPAWKIMLKLMPALSENYRKKVLQQHPFLNNLLAAKLPVVESQVPSTTAPSSLFTEVDADNLMADINQKNNLSKRCMAISELIKRAVQMPMAPNSLITIVTNYFVELCRKNKKTISLFAYANDASGNFNTGLVKPVLSSLLPAFTTLPVSCIKAIENCLIVFAQDKDQHDPEGLIEMISLLCPYVENLPDCLLNFVFDYYKDRCASVAAQTIINSQSEFSESFIDRVINHALFVKQADPLSRTEILAEFMRSQQTFVYAVVRRIVARYADKNALMGKIVAAIKQSNIENSYVKNTNFCKLLIACQSFLSITVGIWLPSLLDNLSCLGDDWEEIDLDFEFNFELVLAYDALVDNLPVFNKEMVENHLQPIVVSDDYPQIQSNNHVLFSVLARFVKKVAEVPQSWRTYALRHLNDYHLQQTAMIFLSNMAASGQPFVKAEVDIVVNRLLDQDVMFADMLQLVSQFLLKTREHWHDRAADVANALVRRLLVKPNTTSAKQRQAYDQNISCHSVVLQLLDQLVKANPEALNGRVKQDVRRVLADFCGSGELIVVCQAMQVELPVENNVYGYNRAYLEGAFFQSAKHYFSTPAGVEDEGEVLALQRGPAQA